MAELIFSTASGMFQGVQLLTIAAYAMGLGLFFVLLAIVADTGGYTIAVYFLSAVAAIWFLFGVSVFALYLG